MNTQVRSSELDLADDLASDLVKETPAITTVGLPRVHLINAKLRPPQLASVLVARDHLLAAIDAAAHKKILLLLAQIGSGKTTLLSQWHERAIKHRSIAWLSLDEQDNDERSFFSYLIAAVQSAAQNFGGYVAGPPQEDADLPLDHITAVILDGLTRIEDDVVIVIDDFQWIDNPNVLRAFRHLLQHSPAHVHWIISSRRALDLPLSQLKLQDQLTVLGTTELNLGSNDIADLNLKLHGHELSSADADYILGRTEGWVAGAKLALLSVTDPNHVGNALSQFTGSHQEVARYLVDAVLRDQPAEVRRFLLISSLVDKMNSDLCNTLLGISNSDQVLERLEQRQLFLQPLDNYRRWYRYHLLFLDFLRSYLSRDYADDIPRLHKIASQWFAEHQMNDEALEHAFAAQDREWCVEITARCARGWMENGHMLEILRWAAQLTCDEILRDSDLCSAYVLSLILTRRFIEAAAMLGKANSRVASNKTSLTENQLRAHNFRLRVLELVFRAETTDRPIDCDDHTIASDDTDTFFAGLLAITQTGHLLYRNQFDAARRLAMRAREIGKQANNLYLMSYGEILTCVADRSQGNIKLAIETCERIFSAVKGAPKSPAWVNAAVALASARYEQNCLTEAHELCVELLPIISATSTIENFLTAYTVLARLKFIQSRAEEAFQLLDYVHSVLDTSGHPRFLAQVCFEKVRLYLTQGNSERAAATARDFGLPQLAARGEWNAARAYEDAWGRYGFTQALLWMDEQRYDECHALLQVLRESAHRAGYTYRLAPIEMALALCHWRADDNDVAFALLNDCLSLNQQSGLGRGVFDDIPGLPALLRTSVDAGRLRCLPPTKYFNQFTSDSIGEPPRLMPISKPIAPLEPLTGREIAILKLVSKGLCNKTISETSRIALTTTKWHLRNAFEKLEVNSRTAAIARARELQLID